MVWAGLEVPCALCPCVLAQPRVRTPSVLHCLCWSGPMELGIPMQWQGTISQAVSWQAVSIGTPKHNVGLGCNHQCCDLLQCFSAVDFMDILTGSSVPRQRGRSLVQPPRPSSFSPSRVSACHSKQAVVRRSTMVSNGMWRGGVGVFASRHQRIPGVWKAHPHHHRAYRISSWFPGLYRAIKRVANVYAYYVCGRKVAWPACYLQQVLPTGYTADEFPRAQTDM
jgi:hypothetical protein